MVKGVRTVLIENLESQTLERGSSVQCLDIMFAFNLAELVVSEK